MRFAFTPEQLELTEAVDKVLAGLCSPTELRAAFEEPSASRSSERWAALSDLGTMGLLISEEHGGLGMDEREFVGVIESLGRAGLPEPLAESAFACLPVLLEFAPELMSGVSDGSVIVIPGGFSVASTGLVVTTEGEGGIVATPALALAGYASHLLLAHHGLEGSEIHLLELGAVMSTPIETLDPSRRAADISWTPNASSLIASGEDADRVMETLALRSAVVAAAQILGLCDTMITMSADYVSQRKQFGVAVGSFQAVKHLLANARVALEFARPAVYRAAHSLAVDQSQLIHDVAIAKSLASEAALLSAKVCLQVHGAIGYTWEYDLHLYQKKAWALAAAWGSAPVWRAQLLEVLRAQRS